MEYGQSFIRFLVRLPILIVGLYLLISRVGTPVFFQEVGRGIERETVFAPDINQLLIFLVGFLVIWAISGFFSGMFYILPEWNKAIVLRFGKHSFNAGPGFFIIPPFIYQVAAIVDMRTLTFPLTATQALSRDNVQVDVDAVLFFRIDENNPERAVLKVQDYKAATNEASQAALKDGIGKHLLTELQSERESVGSALQESIAEKAVAWGVIVSDVNIKDVKIPADLQQAMSRKAQAVQEQEARVILAESELKAANSMAEAAKIYADNPIAMKIRELNLVYEGLTAGNHGIVVVPWQALDSLGGMAGSLAMQQAINTQMTYPQPVKTHPSSSIGEQQAS